MGGKAVLAILASILVALFPGVAMAQHSHGHGATSPATPGMSTSREMTMMKGPVQSKTVEGLKINFEVMSMEAHMAMPGMKGHSQHGGSVPSPSDSFMVAIQDTASKEIISDARVNYTLISPSGGKEAGRLEWSGDHYGGSFSPKEKGSYQVQVTIESGGMERVAEFTYEAK